MPLKYNDQLQLLSDILRNHSYDNCGTSSECQQLHRLANMLMQDSNLDPATRDVLQNISDYGMTGSNHEQLTDHITSNHNYISTWIDSLNGSQHN
jgi:hypothetical protein